MVRSIVDIENLIQNLVIIYQQVEINTFMQKTALSSRLKPLNQYKSYNFTHVFVRQFLKLWHRKPMDEGNVIIDTHNQPLMLENQKTSRLYVEWLVHYTFLALISRNHKKQGA
jgi:hypothetical protein